ncbi:MAG: hypothetical protein DSY58_04655 [Desulfobulbus sp.]|nr:MAG: hypothetical protein DSY58_04655 [Desulfobulbus sp.]
MKNIAPQGSNGNFTSPLIPGKLTQSLSSPTTPLVEQENKGIHATNRFYWCFGKSFKRLIFRTITTFHGQIAQDTETTHIFKKWEHFTSLLEEKVIYFCLVHDQIN